MLFCGFLDILYEKEMKNKILDYFKKINTKKHGFWIGGFVVMCVLLTVYLNYNGNTYQKCPDEYGDDDASFTQKMVDFDNWTKEFYETNPDASLSDLSRARYDFYVKNNCTSSIKRYEDAVAGKGDPETIKLIDDAISR